MTDPYLSVVREVDLLVAEAASLRCAGPHFVIGHRFAGDGVCAPGEEVAFVALRHRAREIDLRLSISEKLLFEALARNRHFPQSATQLAGYMRTEFFARHGANASRLTLVRKMNHSSIKVYVQRLRKALASAFIEAGLELDPNHVLRSERTIGPIGYRLRATVAWRHFDSVGDFVSIMSYSPR